MSFNVLMCSTRFSPRLKKRKEKSECVGHFPDKVPGVVLESIVHIVNIVGGWGAKIMGSR